MTRLDKFICDNSGYSRSQIKKLIQKGGVSVNSVPVRASDFKIEPEKDEVTVCGQKIEYRRFVYLMLNKPEGYVSATEDRREKTVLDLIGEEFSHRALFPAGRLDKDTVGFVLLTDDGDFAHRILSPKNHVPKTYIAKTDKPCDDEVIRVFEEGARLSDGTVCLKAELKLLNDEKTLCEVVICEGMYHQIKRMFASCGRHVVSLERVKMGALALDPALERGEYRELSEEELGLISMTK